MQKKYPKSYSIIIKFPSDDIISIEPQPSLDRIEIIVSYANTHGLMSFIYFNTKTKKLKFKPMMFCPELEP